VPAGGDYATVHAGILAPAGTSHSLSHAASCPQTCDRQRRQSRHPLSASRPVWLAAAGEGVHCALHVQPPSSSERYPPHHSPPPPPPLPPPPSPSPSLCHSSSPSLCPCSCPCPCPPCVRALPFLYFPQRADSLRPPAPRSTFAWLCVYNIIYCIILFTV